MSLREPTRPQAGNPRATVGRGNREVIERNRAPIEAEHIAAADQRDVREPEPFMAVERESPADVSPRRGAKYDVLNGRPMDDNIDAITPG